MARNGSGQFDLLVNSWNPATNNVLASAGDWQSLINDIAAALTQSVSRDGQAPMTGNLALGNNKITGLSQGTGTGQALAFEQLFAQGTMADLASAATTDIGLQNTNFLRITGNTTITSFGTNYRGPRFLVFEGAVTLTNSSTLVLPGGANITTAAGDVLIAIPGATLGTADKWIVAAYQAATGYLKSNNPSYTGTLTGGTGVVNLGSGQFYKDASGNVGIGTTSPQGRLHVRAGTAAMFFQCDDTGQVQLNFGGTTNAVKSGIYYSDNSDVMWFRTGSTERARIDSSGNMQVSNLAGTGNRAVYSTSTGILTNSSSDRSLKENDEPISQGLDAVLAMRPVSFEWVDKDKMGAQREIGFIAQEMQQIVPEVVGSNSDETLSIDYPKLVAVMTKAIQELTARVAALEAA